LRFYIASRLENAQQVRAVAESLKDMGWEHTYDWTVHGSVKNEGEDRIKEVAEKEMQGVRDAEIVIVLLPGGRGTHAELGAANALRIPAIVWAETDDLFCQDDRTCAFYWNSNVTRITGDIINLLTHLKRG
jgi:nucleoside 2-deoxyribosyltransferase